MNELLQALFGKNFNIGQNGILGALGSEGFSNLLQGGMSLYNGMQMGDMLDFQKNLANDAQIKSNLLFDQDQEDRQRRKDLNFS